MPTTLPAIDIPDPKVPYDLEPIRLWFEVRDCTDGIGGVGLKFDTLDVAAERWQEEGTRRTHLWACLTHFVGYVGRPVQYECRFSMGGWGTFIPTA